MQLGGSRCITGRVWEGLLAADALGAMIGLSWAQFFVTLSSIGLRRDVHIESWIGLGDSVNLVERHRVEPSISTCSSVHKYYYAEQMHFTYGSTVS